MQITNGKYKRRKLKSLSATRVIESRVKEVLYGVLGEEIQGTGVLDLFGGIGSMGIEALSWGAKEVSFVDKRLNSVKTIRENVQSLGELKSVEIYKKDVFEAIKKFYLDGKKFDFIFLDPPYNKGLVIKSLKTIGGYDILKNSGYLIALYSFRESIEKAGFFCVFDRQYGDRKVSIYTHF